MAIVKKRGLLRITILIQGLFLGVWTTGPAHAETSRAPVQLPLATLSVTSDNVTSDNRTLNNQFASNTHSVSLEGVDLRGWDYIAKRFVESGVSEDQVKSVFTDSRLPRRETLLFSLNPKESRYNYRKLNTANNRKAALDCYHRYRPAFDLAEKQYSVPASVIVSIVQVETACGKNTGNQQVFHRLLRLAAAATPENIRKNVADKQTAKTNVQTLEQKVKDRAKYLERTFLPHAAATIEVARYKKLGVFDLEGSVAGAVGMPQFLPGHYLSFGVDGNKDGRIDLFRGEDAVPSVGKYLNHFGWKSQNISAKKKRSVIWEYNKSEPYIDTVLAMAAGIEPKIRAARAVGTFPRINKLGKR